MSQTEARQPRGAGAYAACGMVFVHAARIVRLAWGDEDRLPRAEVAAEELAADEEASFEAVLLEACRARRVPITDPERPWRASGYQVVTEADPALADALVAAGGEVVLETLHYAGDL